VRWLGSLLRFVWDFVVGDDWLIAAGVVLALALTALVSGSSVAAWWILPVAAAALLALSVWRAGVAPTPGAPDTEHGRSRNGSSDQGSWAPDDAPRRARARADPPPPRR